MADIRNIAVEIAPELGRSAVAESQESRECRTSREKSEDENWMKNSLEKLRKIMKTI